MTKCILLLDCGDPSFSNGALTTDSETIYNGNTAVICDPGYLEAGQAICGNDGNWAEVPTCNPVGKILF